MLVCIDKTYGAFKRLVHLGKLLKEPSRIRLRAWSRIRTSDLRITSETLQTSALPFELSKDHENNDQRYSAVKCKSCL